MSTKSKRNTSHEDRLTGAVLDDLADQGYRTAEQNKVGTRVLDGLAWKGPEVDKVRAAEWGALQAAVVVETKQHLTAPLLGQALAGVLLARKRAPGAQVRGVAAFAVDAPALREVWGRSQWSELIELDHRAEFRSGTSNYRGESPQPGIDRWLAARGWSAELHDVAGDGRDVNQVVVGRKGRRTAIFTGQAKYAVGRSSIGRLVCARAVLGIEDAVIINTGKAARDMAELAVDLKIRVVDAVEVALDEW